MGVNLVGIYVNVVLFHNKNLSNVYRSHVAVFLNRSGTFHLILSVTVGVLPKNI